MGVGIRARRWNCDLNEKEGNVSHTVSLRFGFDYVEQSNHELRQSKKEKRKVPVTNRIAD